LLSRVRSRKAGAAASKEVEPREKIAAPQLKETKRQEHESTQSIPKPSNKRICYPSVRMCDCGTGSKSRRAPLSRRLVIPTGFSLITEQRNSKPECQPTPPKRKEKEGRKEGTELLFAHRFRPAHKSSSQRELTTPRHILREDKRKKEH